MSFTAAALGFSAGTPFFAVNDEVEEGLDDKIGVLISEVGFDPSGVDFGVDFVTSDVVVKEGPPSLVPQPPSQSPPSPSPPPPPPHLRKSP